MLVIIISSDILGITYKNKFRVQVADVSTIQICAFPALNQKSLGQHIVPLTNKETASNSCNTEKCNTLQFMLTIFCVSPTCFGAVISPSSGSGHQSLFKESRNKISNSKRSKNKYYSSLFKHQAAVL
jgi:hypothetical protein